VDVPALTVTVAAGRSRVFVPSPVIVVKPERVVVTPVAVSVPVESIEAALVAKASVSLPAPLRLESPFTWTAEVNAIETPLVFTVVVGEEAARVRLPDVAVTVGKPEKSYVAAPTVNEPVPVEVKLRAEDAGGISVCVVAPLIVTVPENVVGQPDPEAPLIVVPSISTFASETTCTEVVAVLASIVVAFEQYLGGPDAEADGARKSTEPSAKIPMAIAPATRAPTADRKSARLTRVRWPPVFASVLFTSTPPPRSCLPTSEPSRIDGRSRTSRPRPSS
jgi:hypothetical protein